MVDFCKQCSISLFGKDTEDMAKLSVIYDEELKPEEGWVVICEGCGPTMVNDDGECIAEDCMVDHKTGEMRPPIEEDSDG